MKMRNAAIALAGLSLMGVSTASAAEPLRAASSLPTANSSAAASVLTVRRASTKAEGNSDLFLGLVPLIIVGVTVAVVVTVAVAGGFDGNGSTPG